MIGNEDCKSASSGLTKSYPRSFCRICAHHLKQEARVPRIINESEKDIGDRGKIVRLFSDIKSAERREEERQGGEIGGEERKGRGKCRGGKECRER